MTKPNIAPGETSGQEPKPELFEVLTTTKLTSERIAEVTHEVFEGYDLPNGKVLHIEQRHDQKDGFVNDDKRNKAKEQETGEIQEAQFYIATPADFDKAKGEAVKERVIYKHTPDWDKDPTAKAPRDVLHPFLGSAITQIRKARRDRKDTYLEEQEASERADKRPIVECLIAYSIDRVIAKTSEDQPVSKDASEAVNKAESYNLRSSLKRRLGNMALSATQKINKLLRRPEPYEVMLSEFARYFGEDNPASLREDLDQLTNKSVELIQALAKEATVEPSTAEA